MPIVEELLTKARHFHVLARKTSDPVTKERLLRLARTILAGRPAKERANGRTSGLPKIYFADPKFLNCAYVGGQARCPILAHSRHCFLHRTCPLLGVKRTSR